METMDIDRRRGRLLFQFREMAAKFQIIRDEQLPYWFLTAMTRPSTIQSGIGWRQTTFRFCRSVRYNRI